MTSYRWLFWALAAVGLLLDQATKYGFFSLLYNNGAGGEIVVVENYFTIEAHFHRNLTGTWTGVSKNGKPLTLTFGPNNTVKVQTDTNHGTGAIAEINLVGGRAYLHLSMDWENKGKSAALLDPFEGPLKMEHAGLERGVDDWTEYRRADSDVQWEYPPKVNEGALFGIGAGHNFLFAFVSIAAAVLIVFFSNRPAARRDMFLSIALGLILAGTIGNFYDRMVFSGVRDFIHWFVKNDGKFVTVFGWPADWPIFNIADCCLVVGAGTLLAHAFFYPESRHAAAPKEQEPAIAQQQ